MVNNVVCNPYNPGPLPIPMRRKNLTAPEILNKEVLMDCLHFNRGWIAAQPRTTRHIENALLPHYEMAGMTRAEVFEHLNATLWEAGFRPDEVKENPLWALPKEALIPQDDLGDLWKADATIEQRFSITGK